MRRIVLAICVLLGVWFAVPANAAPVNVVITLNGNHIVNTQVLGAARLIGCAYRVPGHPEWTVCPRMFTLHWETAPSSPVPLLVGYYYGWSRGRISYTIPGLVGYYP